MCIAVFTTGLSACSPGGSSQASNEEPVIGEPETTTVRLAYMPYGHVFNDIAEAQGFLADEGITVEYVPVNTDAEVFEGIANGTIDIASNSGTNLPLEKISDGMDLTIFGGYLLSGCMPVFAKVDTKWTSIEDLIGKTMACESNVYPITGPLLDKGYDPVNEVTWLTTETQEDRIEAVKSGKADFGLVGTDLNYAINTDPDLKVLTYADDVLPAYSCCRVEALTEWINANPNTVKALLRAWIRAMAYYDLHHDEVVTFMSEKIGRDEDYVKAYMDNPHYDLNIDPMQYSIETAWDYMDRLGLLNATAKQMDIKDHINTLLYEQALDECQTLYGDENSSFYEKMQTQFVKHNDLNQIDQ